MCRSKIISRLKKVIRCLQTCATTSTVASASNSRCGCSPPRVSYAVTSPRSALSTPPHAPTRSSKNSSGSHQSSARTRNSNRSSPTTPPTEARELLHTDEAYRLHGGLVPAYQHQLSSLEVVFREVRLHALYVT